MNRFVPRNKKGHLKSRLYYLKSLRKFNFKLTLKYVINSLLNTELLIIIKISSVPSRKVNKISRKCKK